VTVLDTSGAIDFLLGEPAGEEVEALLTTEGSLAAPDLIVFEVLAVLRRDVLRGVIDARRAAGAIEDLGDVGLDLFPSLVLRDRAWGLRENLTAADALFVALAQRLRESLATKDRKLAGAARRHGRIEVIELE
jgi:predicted nucleic acid-binding protein